MLTLRPIQPADLPSVAQLRAQTKGKESFWVDRIGRYLRGEHSPQDALADRSAFVAVDEEKIVGFVAGHNTRRLNCDGELQWLDVDQDQRRRGIGVKLLAQIGDWFVAENLTRICVNVDPDDLPAQKLYAKYGAESLNEHWMIWADSHRMTQL
jgi:ribosomal protein S18 acetylase RimI-like enzyme